MELPEMLHMPQFANKSKVSAGHSKGEILTGFTSFRPAGPSSPCVPLGRGTCTNHTLWTPVLEPMLNTNDSGASCPRGRLPPALQESLQEGCHIIEGRVSHGIAPTPILMGALFSISKSPAIGHRFQTSQHRHPQNKAHTYCSSNLDAWQGRSTWPGPEACSLPRALTMPDAQPLALIMIKTQCTVTCSDACGTGERMFKLASARSITCKRAVCGKAVTSEVGPINELWLAIRMPRPLYFAEPSAVRSFKHPRVRVDGICQLRL